MEEDDEQYSSNNENEPADDQPQPAAKMNYDNGQG